LPAMQTPRCIRRTEWMPSQASQLPQVVLHFGRWICPTGAVGRVWQYALCLVTLPTAKPESPGLCVWMGVSKVLGPLNVQWSGLVALPTKACAPLQSMALSCLSYGGCTQGTSGCAGLCFVLRSTNLCTAATLRLVAKR
jgi:hypothetical protein